MIGYPSFILALQQSQSVYCSMACVISVELCFFHFIFFSSRVDVTSTDFVIFKLTTVNWRLCHLRACPGRDSITFAWTEASKLLLLLCLLAPITRLVSALYPTPITEHSLHRLLS